MKPKEYPAPQTIQDRIIVAVIDEICERFIPDETE